MSQRTGTHDPRTKSADEDVDDVPARQPEGRQGLRPRQAVGQLADDGGATPDEPDEGEVELIGDDDLGAVDLGPAAPNFTDPDAPSGRIRRISPESGREA
jgi:hypothetical protein